MLEYGFGSFALIICLLMTGLLHLAQLLAPLFKRLKAILNVNV